MQGCPVKRNDKITDSTSRSGESSIFLNWLGLGKHFTKENDTSSSSIPIQHESIGSKKMKTEESNAKGSDPIAESHKSNSLCPVKHDAKERKLMYNEKANDIVFDQSILPDQSKKLSTRRAVSSIPNTDYKPAHQPEGIDKWVYPSEQQYFNAMKKKGYDAKEDDVAVILAIHNMVNEQGWSKIKEWESFRCCNEPKLKSFMGRPKDISPKAYFLNMIGYSLPFDRHDWIVDRNGEEVRYVIDFYTGAQRVGARQAPVSIYLDVRPALDSPSAVLDRISFSFRSYFFPNTLPRLVQNPSNLGKAHPK